MYKYYPLRLHKKSASQQAVMLVEVRLPTSGSPQNPRKRDPYWEVVLLLLRLHKKSQVHSLPLFLEIRTYLSKL